MYEEMIGLKSALDDIYNKFNDRKYLTPDPLQFIYNYESIADREIVGMIASSLAYGKVQQINKSVDFVLNKLPSPSKFLKNTSPKQLINLFPDFKHRFTKGEDISRMLIGMKRVIETYGSLEKCFISGMKKDDETVLPALGKFVSLIHESADGEIKHLLPSPENKSACKRLNLFLKWLVRCDKIDPGGWHNVPQNRLIMPVDTHIHRICRNLGLTNRKSADLKTAIEITNNFKLIAPNDPLKYDFALTRLGMKNDNNIAEFYKRIGIKVETNND